MSRSAAHAAELYNGVVAARYQRGDFDYHMADMEEVLRLADLTVGENILDLGCGDGLVAIAARGLVGEQARITAVDCSRDMVELARERVQQSGHQNITVLQGDITDAGYMGALDRPASSSGYDVITCIWCFSTLPLEDQAKTLRIWAALLAPGGRIILDRSSNAQDPDAFEVTNLPTPPPVGLPEGQAKYRIADRRTHKQCREELLKIVREAGLKCTQSSAMYAHYPEHVGNEKLQQAQNAAAEKGGDGASVRAKNQQLRRTVVQADMERWFAHGFLALSKNATALAVIVKGD